MTCEDFLFWHFVLLTLWPFQDIISWLQSLFNNCYFSVLRTVFTCGIEKKFNEKWRLIPLPSSFKNVTMWDKEFYIKIYLCLSVHISNLRVSTTFQPHFSYAQRASLDLNLNKISVKLKCRLKKPKFVRQIRAGRNTKHT